MPIDGLDAFVQELGEQIVADAAQALLDELIEDAPEDTGELKASAYGPFVSGLSAVVGFEAPQAEWTDQGVLPHDIYPVNARALRFFWPDGPQGPDYYTFDHVNHPGQLGTLWFTDGTDDDAWDRHVQDAAEAA